MPFPETLMSIFIPSPSRLGSTLASLFENQAQQRPEAIALVFRDVSLSYGELNRRANALAHLLVKRGLKRGDNVALLVDRSPAMITALLAILKAGGAYVPLDPATPAPRLRFMISDARPRIVLTQDAYVDRLRGVACEVLPLDSLSTSGFSADNPRLEASPDDLAYLMYTSGSTGQPKSVAVRQRGILRLFKNQDLVPLGPGEVLLQVSSIGFDPSAWEIWGALCQGARLVLYPQPEVCARSLAEVLRKHRVTTLFLTPGVFQLMVSERLEGLSGLRRLLVGGDVLPVRAARKLLATSWPGVLINAYGPTEVSVFSTFHPMRAGQSLGERVPIGQPVCDTRAWVLDSALKPVAPGETGELYLGGTGLAQGYWNRPDLTVESFIPNPFSTEASDRLYRTGDLVRRLPDGVLEFLGRKDNHVRIRGSRVELGDVEAAMIKHRAVGQAAAVVDRFGESGEQLVAFYTAGPGGPSAAELREFLGQSLPPIMVPAHFLKRTALPLTPSGKVDRKRLAEEAALARLGRQAPLVAPRTPVEQELAAIWQENLGIAGVGMDDGFVELGGHSLVAAKIVAEVERKLGASVSLQSLFEDGTVARQAARVETQRKP